MNDTTFGLGFIAGILVTIYVVVLAWTVYEAGRKAGCPLPAPTEVRK